VLAQDEVATDAVHAGEVYLQRAALDEKLNGLLAEWEIANE